MSAIVVIIDAFFLTYFISSNTIYLLMLLRAIGVIRKTLRADIVTDHDKMMSFCGVPQLSILVPAHNEEEHVVHTVDSLSKIKYPTFEIIVVDDGSSDRTTEKLIEQFHLQRREIPYRKALQTEQIIATYESNTSFSSHLSRIVLIKKRQGGKADALNAAVNAAKNPYICSVDADTVMDEDALIRVMEPIIQNPKEVVASGGQVGIANGSIIKEGKIIRRRLSNNPLVLFQNVEYLQSFTIGRTALASINSLLVLSGTFSVIKRSLLEEIGGFLSPKIRSKVGLEYCGKDGAIGEDMEIILRIHRYLFDKGKTGRVAFLPHPITWTHVPETLSQLAKQRNRWYRGLTESLHYHRKMLFNPDYGRIGLIATPYEFVFEFLSPFIELTGYVVMPILYFAHYLSLPTLLLFLVASIGYGTTLSVLAVLIGIWPEHGGFREASLFPKLHPTDMLKFILFAFLFHLGYRQLKLAWHWGGFFSYLRKRKEW